MGIAEFMNVMIGTNAMMSRMIPPIPSQATLSGQVETVLNISTQRAHVLPVSCIEQTLRNSYLQLPSSACK